MEEPSDADLLMDVTDDPFALDAMVLVGDDGWSSARGGEEESKEPEPEPTFARAGSKGEPVLRPPKMALEEATVARLREEISRLHVPDYSDELRKAAKTEEVTLGMLSPEEVAEREAALEDARIREAAREAERFARREAALAIRQARARANVVDEKVRAVSAVREKEMQALESRAEVEEAVRRAYREARAALAMELKRQQAVVMERYGVLEGQPQGALARAKLAKQQIRVAWSHVPQPLKLTVHQVRGVKNRLPRGRYVLLATLWDRLGGRPLRWSQMSVGAGAGSYRGLARPASTRPVRHAGRFYSTEMDFNGQSIHTLCPASVDLAPSNCVVLELFLLGGKRSPVDRVVGWTAVPCSDSDLRPIEGRFQLPMLRGEVDLDVDQFVKMEQRWGADLDNWLGNMYIEVSRIPREQTGDGGALVGEFDVEIAYTSEVLRLRQSRLRQLDDSASGSTMRKRGKSSRGKSFKRQSQEELDEAWDRAGSDEEGGGGSSAAASGGGKSKSGGMSKRGLGRSKTRGRGKGGKAMDDDEAAATLTAAWESDEEGEDAWAGGVAIASRRAAGAVQQGRVEQAVPGAARGTTAARWRDRPLANLQSYGFAVSKQEARGIGRGRRLGEASRKGVYLRQELFGDLLPRGLNCCKCTCQWNATSLLQLLALLVALYVRAHVHYIGQWLFLQGQRIPVYELSLTPWGMALKYVGSVLPMEYELGVVIIGPLAVLAFFTTMCLVCYLLFLVLRHIPEMLSRFVAFFGLAAILNPAMIFLFDLASSNFGCTDPAIHPACVADFTSAQCRCFEGDMFKLYYRFLRTEGSGVVGVILTMFVYAVEMLLAAFLLYAFLVNLHLDGRMLDLYRRIHAPDEAFSQPLDLEISLAELKWIISRSKRWDRNAKAVRRVAVCEYVLTDPLDASFREVTQHLVVYTSTLGGSRELYRHFLRIPDGTLVEVFGDLDSSLGGAAGRKGEASPLQQVLLKAANNDEDAVHTFFGGI
jgi:hypothetical protein